MIFKKKREIKMVTDIKAEMIKSQALSWDGGSLKGFYHLF
jgi:hypothetical protein